MKIAMLHGPRDLRMETHEFDATLAPDQIHVRTEISAFKIGTDRGNYEGAEAVPGSPDFPRPVGDSNLGIVQAVGTSVKGLKPGDRVVSRGWHQSELICGPNLHPVRVPENVSSEDAVWAHLYTLSAKCYRKAFFTPGEYVAVVGLGVLGLGAVALGPYLGGRVIGLGNDVGRLEMATRMGAEHVLLSDDPNLAEKLNDITNGLGVDLVILTANPWPAWRTACQAVRPNGRVACVALPGRGEAALGFNPLAMEWFYNKGIALIAINGQNGYLFPTPGSDRFGGVRGCEHTLSLMARGMQPSQLITHRLPYADMATAYEMAYARDKSMLGVIFDWSGA